MACFQAQGNVLAGGRNGSVGKARGVGGVSWRGVGGDPLASDKGWGS